MRHTNSAVPLDESECWLKMAIMRFQGPSTEARTPTALGRPGTFIAVGARRHRTFISNTVLFETETRPELMCLRIADHHVEQDVFSPRDGVQEALERHCA